MLNIELDAKIWISQNHLLSVSYLFNFCLVCGGFLAVIVMMKNALSSGPR